jgi:cytochrome c oxidase assembly protein subunit 15
MLMVVVGGATRLTHSGLSMANWKPLHVLPPLNSVEWAEEFETYQQTPEYKKINSHMTVNEFKTIFWWEYFHRLLARIVGLIALLPLVLFFKRTPNWLKIRMFTIFAVGGLQGVIGWWMVKSGLSQNPAVSHIRLAIHLSMAFIILTLLIHTLWKLNGKQFKTIVIRDKVLLGLISVTIIYGAFVAGLKAGLIYNTFPLMEGQLIPNEWNFYKTLMINFIHNPATVQFMHRILGLSTLAYAFLLWLKWGRNYTLITIKLCIQVVLGITTLVLIVPIEYALLHQAWAMVVWIVALKTVWIKQ